MKVEDLVKYIMPEVPGCPEPTIERALVFATDEFLRHTHALQVTSDPVDLEAGVSEYDMEAIPGGMPLTITKVWLPSLVLRPVSMEELSQLLPNWQSATSTEPRFYNMVGAFGKLKVYPTPIEPISVQMTFQAVYTIKNTSTTIPDEIVAHYLETIAAGAKARLMMMPGVAWSNLQLADAYMQQFSLGKSNAKIDIAHSRVPGSLRVKPVAFGRYF